MVSKEQLMIVGTNCPEYNAINPGFSATIGGKYSESCENCHYWENNRCQIDVFDDVLTSIDQE
ncbi:hypothetical protein NSA47_06915 [Irregularibacter muris]|uniref:Uncharacterized protein n=1 Tax=Irregularibacter muris TaxID=1796619 RepID=A0AAE3HDZ7_9FIRM|nr:hypothetical protein [Irregularibacter muris]MCR1898722.1 hypothetical protein [Irregularibacter muris]